ncbi:STAS domain-containing protein [Streptomyces olivaceus]|uniref:STAS domain-containing protein n=1 Tax=Streptomyces olivaceus TaxID=47716 RepID=UPI0036272E0C
MRGSLRRCRSARAGIAHQPLSATRINLVGRSPDVPPEPTEEIRQRGQDGGPRVVFCDSSGFNALLRLRHRALEAGSRLALAAPPDAVGRLLTLTGANTVFPLYGSLAEARTQEARYGEGD